jgi:type I restriction enzyme, R subunit
MSNHPCTEDQLVEQPAIGLFAELGWQTVSAMEKTFGEAGTLEREMPKTLNQPITATEIE